jgi:hypothetical protein
MIIQSKLGISEIFNQNDKLENISFITWKKVSLAATSEKNAFGP